VGFEPAILAKISLSVPYSNPEVAHVPATRCHNPHDRGDAIEALPVLCITQDLVVLLVEPFLLWYDI